MRAPTLTLCLCLLALPLSAQSLPQIEPEESFPVWGSPDERRAYFEAEQKRMEEERARLEAEAAARAAERAAAAAAAAEAEAAEITIIPRLRTRANRVLVCREVPVDRPRLHPGWARKADESRTFQRRPATVERCRWVLRDRLHRRGDRLVLRYGPDGFSGRLRLSGPNGKLIIEAR